MDPKQPAHIATVKEKELNSAPFVFFCFVVEKNWASVENAE